MSTALQLKPLHLTPNKASSFAFKQSICPNARSLLTVHVLQEFWEVEELRDELFDVSWTLHASLPGCCH